MTREQIEQLSERIASGVASDAEIALYNRMCNSFQVPQDWDDDLYGDQETIRAEMLAAINKKSGGMETAERKTVLRRGYFKWV